ncbi:hypothetical protein AGMMS50239_32130 [Bacteroidia bacterium]|nr:hypothetical protein AGMMS50239_32130 [Bacteroidia bacterium]
MATRDNYEIASYVSGTLTVTPLVPPTFGVSIGTLSNGSVSASPNANITAGETVTLTVTPDAGYELDNITVTGSGGAVETRLIASLQTYTFVMPASGVTVNATFKKTQAQLDRESVEAARAAIEGGTFRVAMSTANDAAGIKTWLAGTLNVRRPKP